MTASAQPVGDWGPHAASLACRTLTAMLESGRLPHALLIAGPIGVGKRDFAIRTAQAMLCESIDPSSHGPCRTCRTCRRLHDPSQPMLDPQHTDVEVITPGALCIETDHDHRNSRSIGICIVRRIERAANLAPFEADRRIFVITPADRLTAEAADAFLKTLEEPPDGVHFILLTAREAELPETIRSRCRTLTLSPLPPQRLDAWIDRWSNTEEVSMSDDPASRAELSRLARGRPGWLQVNLREGDPVTLRAAQIDDAVRIAESDRAERLNWSEQLVGRVATPQGVANVELILEAWTDWWRDLWLQQTDQPDSLTHVSQRDRVERNAALYDQHEVSQFLEMIQRTRALVQRGVNARLALDVLLLNIPVPRESP